LSVQQLLSVSLFMKGVQLTMLMRPQ
jgi:hypothetical protein